MLYFQWCGSCPCPHKSRAHSLRSVISSKNGRVAQLAEHSALNRQVEGSIPSASTIPIQLGVLLLQFLQPLGLVHLQTAVFVAPAVEGLLKHSTPLQACGVVLLFAIATSICRRMFTICSGVRFFPRVFHDSFHTSLSHYHWHRICRGTLLKFAP